MMNSLVIFCQCVFFISFYSIHTYGLRVAPPEHLKAEFEYCFKSDVIDLKQKQNPIFEKSIDLICWSKIHNSFFFLNSEAKKETDLEEGFLPSEITFDFMVFNILDFTLKRQKDENWLVEEKKDGQFNWHLRAEFVTAEEAKEFHDEMYNTQERLQILAKISSVYYVPQTQSDNYEKVESWEDVKVFHEIDMNNKNQIFTMKGKPKGAADEKLFSIFRSEKFSLGPLNDEYLLLELPEHKQQENYYYILKFNDFKIIQDFYTNVALNANLQNELRIVPESVKLFATDYLKISIRSSF